MDKAIEDIIAQFHGSSDTDERAALVSKAIHACFAGYEVRRDKNKKTMAENSVSKEKHPILFEAEPFADAAPFFIKALLDDSSETRAAAAFCLKLFIKMIPVFRMPPDCLDLVKGALDRETEAKAKKEIERLFSFMNPKGHLVYSLCKLLPGRKNTGSDNNLSNA